MDKSETVAAMPTIEGKQQSIWVHFIADVAEIVLEFLDEIDACGYLNMICKEWSIRATERTYSRLCHRVYLSQTDKKILNVLQWGGLWRNMLTNRPRLRTNGIYWLRTSTWKKPHNDMFWLDKISEFIEVGLYFEFLFILICTVQAVHFRHFRFFDDGRLLYAMNNSWPIDALSLFQSRLPVHKKIFPGRYRLTRNVVQAEV